MPSSATRCRTFTHHVGDAIRVECQQHNGWFVDVGPQAKDAEQTSRQLATEVQRDHASGAAQ